MSGPIFSMSLRPYHAFMAFTGTTWPVPFSFYVRWWEKLMTLIILREAPLSDSYRMVGLSVLVHFIRYGQVVQWHSSMNISCIITMANLLEKRTALFLSHICRKWSRSEILSCLECIWYDILSICLWICNLSSSLQNIELFCTEIQLFAFEDFCILVIARTSRVIYKDYPR